MSETKTFVFPENGGSNGIDPNLWAALQNNGGFSGNGSWIWVIFLFFLYGWRGNGFGGNGNGMDGNLAGMINGDYGRNMLMEAINGNGNAINNLATQMNCSTNEIQNAINGVQQSLCNIGNQVGMSAQQVINSINSGNSALGSQLASCCCDIKTQLSNCCCNIQDAITRGNYENQIATLNQTNVLSNSINSLGTGVERGFSQTAYETASQTCDIKQAINNNTMSVLAKLDAIEDSRKDREIASLTAKLAEANSDAKRRAELAPIIGQLNEISCKQPQTVTLPYSCATAVPTALAYQNGLFGNGFLGYNGSLWA